MGSEEEDTIVPERIIVEGNNAQDPTEQVESARKAFDQEFGRFARFIEGSAELGLTLTEADSEQRALKELRTRHLGKKSALAASKKLIGRVGPDARAGFGQVVQSAEAQIVSALDQAEQTLGDILQTLRNERESIDVTLPGRRP